MSFISRALRGGSKRQARVRAGTLLLLAVGLLLVAAFWLFQPFKSVQARIADSLFQEGDTPPQILLAEIDDKSLDSLVQYGRFSDWPRTLHAQAVANLARAGARVIVFDVLFVDPSQDDAKLAEAFKAAGNVVLPVSAAGESVGHDAGDRYQFPTLLTPPEPLRSAAALLGHVNIPSDPDGILRRVPLEIRDTAGHEYSSAAVAALYVETLRQPAKLVQVNGQIRVLNQNVPVDDAGAFRPKFSVRESKFDRISYADAINGKLDASKVKGKIVLIGLTATGAGDVRLTPLGGELPGVAALGNALNSLEDGTFVREVSRGEIALGLLPLVAVTMYAVPRLNLRLSALIVLLFGVLTYVFNFALFLTDQHWLMNFVYPGLLLGSLYVVGLGYKVTSERADRRELSDLFGRYASPEIVRELADAADRGDLDLGGTLREVTVLFADLRGFTGVSERLPPTEVVMFLNRAFDIMIRCIVRNDGIVNKFGGDMVMAIWNAPYDTPDHAMKACRAALEALEEMDKSGLTIPDEPDAKFGFGINSGEVVAGNVGSAGRLEYTVIGDPVNVASRLCGAAGGGEVWIGERTLALTAERLETVGLGPQTLKGRSRPAEAFRVLSLREAKLPSLVAKT